MTDTPLVEAGLPTLLKEYLYCPGDPETAELHEAAWCEVNALARHDPDLCWRFLELAADAPLTDMQAAYIAAGPLEDLLGHHCEVMKARVEEAARRDPGMRRMLGGVWKGGMSNDEWAWFTGLCDRLGVKPL